MALSLPLEIWLNVFGHLNYTQLKKLFLVNRLFHHLLSAPQLDEALFRIPSAPTAAITRYSSGTSTLPDDNRVVKLHPVLKDLPQYLAWRYPHATNACPEKFSAVNKAITKARDLFDNSIAGDSAVWPPVQNIRMRVQVYSADVQQYNELWGFMKARCLTVEDVIHVLLEHAIRERHSRQTTGKIEYTVELDATQPARSNGPLLHLRWAEPIRE